MLPAFSKPTTVKKTLTTGECFPLALVKQVQLMVPISQKGGKVPVDFQDIVGSGLRRYE